MSWKSFKQGTFADSTTDAEYIAASEAAKEVVWIRKFINELGEVSSASSLQWISIVTTMEPLRRLRSLDPIRSPSIYVLRRDRKSTRLNSSHNPSSRMPSSA